MPAMRDTTTTRQRPKARSSRAVCRTTVRLVQAAQDRAAWRFALARIARDLLPLGPTATVREFSTILMRGEHTLRDGTTVTLPRCPDLGDDESLTDPEVARRVSPSEAWVRTVRCRPESEMTLAHFADRPRSGRPAAALPPALEQVVTDQVMRPGGASESIVLRAVQTYAAAHAVPVPSRRRVRRALHAIPHAIDCRGGVPRCRSSDAHWRC
jgi:hypothetical protein